MAGFDEVLLSHKEGAEIATVVISKFFIDEVFNKNSDAKANTEVDVVSYKI